MSLIRIALLLRSPGSLLSSDGKNKHGEHRECEAPPGDEPGAWPGKSSCDRCRARRPCCLLRRRCCPRPATSVGPAPPIGSASHAAPAAPDGPDISIPERRAQ
ncbi:hypothetical protein C8Q69DRAFT_459257 [Paecilomyces variotii]|uniref:Uncharacterized protein n=1 Tax=Byssochlamys spectabilis TaxID=264951 RepID=A0A443I388_BYSSP|nr:hypothetical protein C8Q69DRAFT_459257 [Paecilomyces variotii]RWQ98530.1 hypothetical protein C8Q69DRAFT_459257 [Paecilomyces variotii]